MTLDRQARRKSIIACIASTMTMSVTLGLCWPLLALLLERQGVPTWLNGLSASAQMLAVLAVMPIAPVVIGRLGTATAMALGTVIMALGLSLLPIFDNVWAWFPIRFGLGLGAELVFIAGDIWINQLAEERTRGRLIGVYGIFLHGGFAVGPLAIIALGTEDWSVLYLAIGIVLSGLVILALARKSAPASGERPKASLVHFVRVARTLMIAGLMFGLMGSSVESLLPVYGIDKGIAEQQATLLLTIFVLGSLLAQLPVGWLADHIDGRSILIGGALITLLCLVALPFSMGRDALMWPVMLTMGASSGSFYIAAMTIMGRRFRGADLIGVNTSFVFVWGVGAAVGPGISGLAMDVAGPDGMPGVGIVLCVIFLVVCVRGRSEPVDTRGAVQPGDR